MSWVAVSGTGQRRHRGYPLNLIRVMPAKGQDLMDGNAYFLRGLWTRSPTVGMGLGLGVAGIAAIANGAACRAPANACPRSRALNLSRFIGYVR
jgi:hypothetical protein